jgi:DNA repair protein RecN (Recombination protein N)
VLAFAENARAELETIAHATERIAELEEEETQPWPSWRIKGLALSAQRQAAAETRWSGWRAN